MPKIVLASFIITLVSFWLRNDLGYLPTPHVGLKSDPVQTPSTALPFTVDAGKRRYKIEPKFDYEIYGLVVSYQHHDGNYGLHKSWGDHINVADVCVVWSDNAFTLDLTQFDFWNGQFTCVVKTSSYETWSKFRMDQLSNNHLITSDPQLKDRISNLRVGDQIHIKGMLAHYSGGNGGTRKTSTTRTDTGDGACETIYVKEFNLLQRYYSPWRIMMYISMAVMALSLFIYFITPHRVKD